MGSAFEEELRRIVAHAQALTVSYLQRRLAVTDGVIDRTPSNLRALRNLNDLFMQFLDESGYQRLVNAFTGEFAGQLPFLRDTMRVISEQLQRPFTDLKFGPRDLSVFSAFRGNTMSALETVIESGAGAAMQRAMLAVGGMKFKDLVVTLADRLTATVPQARTVADTSMSMFYRTITDRAFGIIHKDLPSQELRYRFMNPEDMKTRPWCFAMVERTRKRSLTREEIDQFPNGQLPNPFISGGGFNCRGQWILDTYGLLERMQAAKAA